MFKFLSGKYFKVPFFGGQMNGAFLGNFIVLIILYHLLTQAGIVDKGIDRVKGLFK